MIKICGICGAEFVSEHHRQKYCSKECQLEANRRRNKASYHRVRNRCKASKKSGQTLIELTVAARQRGMTYGQYVAMIERGAR